MAEKSIPDKMAVSCDNQLGNTPRKDSSSRDGVDLKNPQAAQRPVLDGLPKKRSTFKITSITKNDPRGPNLTYDQDADGDSLDDLDESHTEEVSSEILDSSRNTDVELDATSEDTTHNLTPDDTGLAGKDKMTDVQSRFKVVKIETHEPFRRGRWLCHDFLDPAQAIVEKTEVRGGGQQEESHSGNSSAGSSIHYVHGADDPNKNPLSGAVQPNSQGHVNTALNTGQMGHTASDQSISGGVQSTGHASIQQTNSDFQPINPAQSNTQPAQIQGGVQNMRGETPGPQLPNHGQVLAQGGSQSVLHQNQQQSHQPPVSQQKSQQINQGTTQGLQQQAQSLQQQQPHHSLVQPQLSNPGMSHSQSLPGVQSVPQNAPHQQGGPHSTNLSQPPINAMQPPVLHPSQGIPSNVNTGGLPASHLTAPIPEHLKNSASQAGGAIVPYHTVGHPSSAMNHIHQSSLSHDNSSMNVRKVSAPSTLQSVPASDASAMPVEKIPHHGGTSSVAAAEGLPKGTSSGHLNHMEGSKREFLRLDYLGGEENAFVGADAPSGEMTEHTEPSTPLLTPLAAAVGGLSSPTKDGKEENQRMRPHSNSSRSSNSGSPPPSSPISPNSASSTPSPAMISVQQYYLYSGYQSYNMNPQMNPANSRNRGSNTLAIDNKIGEAMDLVKSHLMLTVRAEVGVLKEQIKELKEKNSKLEYENSILKAAASPETLAKLSQS